MQKTKYDRLPAEKVASYQKRIKEKSAVNENGCWVWQRSLDSRGYPKFKISKRKTAGGHRISYIVFNGEISPGMLICHKCDVKSCVNPEHLFQGTSKDNAQDCIRKRRHTGTKLSPHDVAQMRDMRRNGLWAKDIAKIFNVSKLTASDAITGKSHSHLPGAVKDTRFKFPETRLSTTQMARSFGPKRKIGRPKKIQTTTV